MLAAARLRELLHFEPDTGVWTWLVSTTNRIHAGDAAGTIDKNGYRQIGIDGRRYLSRRLAFLYMRGSFPENEIDHKNRDKADDRWSNLREVRDVLTSERLKELLCYEPETGRWTWLIKATRGPRCAGAAAGSICPDGYRRIHVEGREYSSNRLAFFYMRGSWPEHEIDHKNLIRTDDRWENLRPATRAQNSQNHRVRKDSFTGVKGVTLRKRNGVPVGWYVQIWADGKLRRRTVCHGSLAEATALREQWARELHGEFARTE